MVVILEKKTPQQVLAEMNELIGMDDAKGDARAFVLRTHFDEARARNGLKSTKQSQHTVFTGNPGTGKTTLARLRAELLYSLGLAGPRYLEISRENMVGEFIGQTEKKMVEFFKSAVKWDGSGDILTLGVALAVVILAATAYSYVLARFSSEHGDP